MATATTSSKAARDICEELLKADRRDKIPDGHPNSPMYGHLKLPHLN